MRSFSDLGISESYQKALKEIRIEQPTEVQRQCIPMLLTGKTDFIGIAQTGTGKTAAFGLPLLAQIDASNPAIQGIILAPTRELVQQIKKQLFKFTKYEEEKIFLEAIYGGEKIEKQIKSLERTTHIIVATPGRLMDHIERSTIDLSQIHTIVLDEADEMLGMGFKNDITKILKYTKKQRNIWLFSATMPEDIKRLIKSYMPPNAPKVQIAQKEKVNANISHLYRVLTIKEKADAIMAFMEEHVDKRGVIFCRTKAGTQNLANLMIEEGYAVAALEGNMQQKERDKVMRAFRKHNLQALISTDVSARGIDVQDLAYVIHHQLPEQIDFYTHRSGRTARAGKKGVSLALILANEKHKIKELEKDLVISFKEI